jgi:hypothetical protein
MRTSDPGYAFVSSESSVPPSLDMAMKANALAVFAAQHSCQRIYAILPTRSGGTLRFRHLQPLDTALGQQCAKSEPKRSVIFGDS